MGFWLEWALNSLPRGFPIVWVTRRELFCFVCRARMWIEPEKKNVRQNTSLFFCNLVFMTHILFAKSRSLAPFPNPKKMYHANVYIPGDGDTEGISNPACDVFPRPPRAWMCAHFCSPRQCQFASTLAWWSAGPLLFQIFFYFTSDFCPLTSIHTTVLWFLALNHCSFLLKNIWWFPISWLKTSIKNVYILE